jgi:hypothetical protein
MVRDSHLQGRSTRWASRAIYSFVIGVGAFFAHFSSKYQWVTQPEYGRIKGAWLEPFMPLLRPHFPILVVVLGVGFLLFALYCVYRYVVAGRSGGSAA